MFCSNYTPRFHYNTVANINDALADDAIYITDSIHPIGADIMEHKILQKGETIAERLLSACVAFSADEEHAYRLATYISKGWFMFATPLLANGGTRRGLPISCFLNYVEDSLYGLAEHYKENIFLSTGGGGIGAHWSDVRSNGEETSSGSVTTGIIPFMNVADAQVKAFKQGRTRQGAYATYLDVSHPEILEYLSMRSADGGDQTRKSFHTHIGVNLSDDFMRAVKDDSEWNLIDPHSLKVKATVAARDIWNEIIKRRYSDRGEPYLFFIDTANRESFYSYDSGKEIHGSNLCTEITLATGPDETAVCCLSSINGAKAREWMQDEQFIYDLVLMLDIALDVFIAEAPQELHRAVRTAVQERSIGLGLMGCHTFDQLEGERFGYSVRLSRHIQRYADQASKKLGMEYGCPEEAQHLERRHTHITAIAPNSSSAYMLGVSPGIEPYRSNYYTAVVGPVVGVMKNPQLDKVIEGLATDFGEFSLQDYSTMWDEVKAANGSVQGVSWLDEDQKEIFKTFAEIDQARIVGVASRRQRFIDQAQSVNLCFNPKTTTLKKVNEVHLLAWTGVEGGDPLKSLYYCRTDVVDKIESTSTQATRDDVYPGSPEFYDTAVEAEFSDEEAACVACSIAPPPEDEGECLVCQG